MKEAGAGPRAKGLSRLAVERARSSIPRSTGPYTRMRMSSTGQRVHDVDAPDAKVEPVRSSSGPVAVRESELCCYCNT